MLKAVGFDDEDLAKPLIGVCTTWIETMPCNLNQRALAPHVKRGIREAGGTPMEFNTIAVSDGVSMGTTGMKASLVSRGSTSPGSCCTRGRSRPAAGAGRT
jgi:dihydroxy-acid dehydratase